MKNVIRSVVAVAGLAAVASAGISRLDLQVSLDGQTWSDSVTVSATAAQTARVLTRAVISYIPDAGEAAPIGFASLTWQPVFSNIRTGQDQIAAFSNQGNNTNGGAIIPQADTDGPFGRVIPFAGTGPSTSQSYVVHTHTAGSGGAPAGNFFRIARNDITRWVGLGPTTTVTAVNNFNGSGGVATVQKLAGRVAADPAISYDVAPVILVLGIDVRGVGSGLSHVIGLDAPLLGMSRDSATGNRQAAWMRDLADASGGIKGIVQVDGAEIRIIPAPGSLALLGLGGLIVGRRRR